MSPPVLRIDVPNPDLNPGTTNIGSRKSIDFISRVSNKKLRVSRESAKNRTHKSIGNEKEEIKQEIKCRAAKRAHLLEMLIGCLTGERWLGVEFDLWPNIWGTSSPRSTDYAVINFILVTGPRTVPIPLNATCH